MNYINITAAAENWSLTPRRVQELCKKGEIVGAVRFGRAWMIPENAAKPMDGRTRRARQMKEHDCPHLPTPRKSPILTHTDLYSEAGTADEVVAKYADNPEIQKILEAQFACMRGNIDKAYEYASYFLNAHSGFNAVVGAGAILSKCALWYGDINLWQSARKHIYEAPCKDDEDRKALEFWLSVSDGLIHDIDELPEWFEKGKFDCLHADSYGAARVFYVKSLFISALDLASGKITLANVRGLGLMRTLPYIIEPMICQAKIDRAIIPEIYLHLMAGAVYHNIGDEEEAARHVDIALDGCLPDKLYGILVEHRQYLDNLLDDRLLLRDEHALKTVKDMHRTMNAGFVKLHNKFTERNVSGSLTVREREVAKLAAYGLSNMEIAQRLKIEVSSVKRYIFTAMNKVGANKRTELGRYI